MNVVGSRPDGWWRDRRGAMSRLIERLARFAEASGDAVTVVFDGQPFDVPAAGGRGPEVLFAARRGRNAADDRIVEIVAGATPPRSLRVVTSDGELSRRVAALGAAVEGARSFTRRLDDGPEAAR